jgi:replication factor C subunit 3/5
MMMDDAKTLHKDTFEMLEKLAQSDDFPHILFYGPSGAGKRTMIKCLLHELYKSASVHKIKSEHKEFKPSATSSTIVECIVFSSNYHIEVTPSEAE